MINKLPQQKSAATLELSGSTGHFQVGRSNSEHGQTLGVRYFLTYVSLSQEGVNDQVLSQLAPVREVFRVEDLQFDEIMQRDIDDARVSEELIPYLLDARQGQLVRLFPPVVVMLLPTAEGGRRPAPLYPQIEAVESDTQPVGDDIDYSVATLRCGSLGSELFEMQYVETSSGSEYHDLNRLRFNPSKARLVIVDGQHRAMALLAMHRNLTNGWGQEERTPYREFYSHWTPELLGEYDLADVSLPMIVCTIPELVEGYQGDMDLLQASRSVFLALNRNARKVSESRNRLLDDNDLIAVYMREVLSHHKSGSAPNLFHIPLAPIWSLELDQSGPSLSNDSAITGVNHIYYIVEHLLLRHAYTSGVGERSGYYGSRTTVFLDRIEASKVLNDEMRSSTRRDNFADAVAEATAPLFWSVYGHHIATLLSAFPPLRAWWKAFDSVREEIRREETPQVERILFGGQGFSTVVSDHIRKLKKRAASDATGTHNLDATREAITHFELLDKRRKAWVAKSTTLAVRDWLSLDTDQDLDEELYRGALDLLGDFRTQAFQAALALTPLEMIDRLVDAGGDRDLATESDVVEDYRDQVFAFFSPESFEELSGLLLGLRGHMLREEDLHLTRNTGIHSYREVVLRGELKPDKWPLWRYLLLEVWDPANNRVAEHVMRERETCREEIMDAYFKRELRAYASSEQVMLEDVSENDRRTVFDAAFNRYEAMLEALGHGSLSKEHLERVVLGS